MTDNIESLNPPKTPLQIAREELAKETAQKAVKLLKAKLQERQKAEAVLANIDREIEDLEQKIDDGNVLDD